MTDASVEVWLRGPIDGFDPWVTPVAHSLLQVREDMHALAAQLAPEVVWLTPGGAASVGFHVRHLGGALDRLFTYARGETLSDAQKSALRSEPVPGEAIEVLVAALDRQIDAALDQLRTTASDELLTRRAVGRAALPSTTLGLLFHAAEHSTRHAAQAMTTAKILMAQA